MASRSSSSRGRGGGNPAARMMLVRQVHAYLTVFVAPSILFFAFTGALQLFSLHEAHDGYEPPALIERLGRLHKDQTLTLKPRRASPPKPARVVANGDWVAPAKAPHDDDDDAQPAKVTALKWLFLAAALVLIVSTLLGLWMALTQNRHRIILLVLFILGAAAPVGILLLL